MRLGKRLISCLLVLCLILSLSVMPVSAEDDVFTYPEYGTKAYGRMEFMKALGFFDESRSAELGNGVTRAEFANWLCLISNKKDVVLPSGVVFADVNEDTPYYSEIIKAVAAGYISGRDDGKYYPNALITKQEAAAALVRLTGRDTFALAKGGYPSGYLSVANSLDILQSVGTGESAYNLLTMCYNTLDASMLVFSGASSLHTIYTTSQKVMEYFHDIYEVEGVMTANNFTKLYSEDTIASTESVEIDNVVYTCNSAYNDLLGMTVQGFYRYDEENDERIIVSIYADEDDNEVMEFDCDDLIPSDLTADYILKYSDKNSRTKKVKLKRGFDYIYNNRVDEDRDPNDLFTADSIKLIDKDDDDFYDTVIAERCETMLLSSVDMYKEIVYTNTAVLAKSDNYGSYMSFEYYDEDTDSMSEVFPEQLEEGMVLSVYRSLDGMYIKAYASSDVASGTVTGYDNELNKVMLNDVWYDLADSITISDFEAGTDPVVFLDVFGRLAFLESVGGKYEFKYAWLFSVRENMDADAVVVKLVTKGGIKTLELHEDVIIDGIRAIDTAALILDKQLIRYKINKAGKVRVIDTIATGSGSGVNDLLSEDVAAVSQKIYPSAMIIDGKYKVTGDTFTLTVPGLTSERDNIDLYEAKVALPSTEPNLYTVACYDVNDEDASIGAFIYYPQYSLMGQQSLDAGVSGIAVIERIKRNIWIDGDVEDVVTLHTSVGEQTFLVGESITDDDLDDFSFGDVVRYATNSFGEISTLSMECDVTNVSGATHPSSRVAVTEYESGYYNMAFGRVLKKKSDYFILLSNENNAGFASDTLANRRIIPSNKTQECWLVDMSENKIADFDVSNVAEYVAGAESPSYVYARTYKYNNLTHLIVYKY